MAEFLLHPFNLHYGFLSDGASYAKTGYHPGRKRDGAAEFVSDCLPHLTNIYRERENTDACLLSSFDE
jgi:hypothetical protein